MAESPTAPGAAEAPDGTTPAEAPGVTAVAPGVAPPPEAKEPSRLRKRYEQEVVPALAREFNLTNPMRVPRIVKVNVNVGVGEAKENAKALDATVRDISAITGQKPVVKKARKSIAQFKLRAGMSIGVAVTLRGERMWEFLDRLINTALPRTRDFRGVPTRSFDGRGNYTLGIREQLIFPEIEYDRIDKVRGLEVSIVTTAPTDQEARRLLELLGMPFQRDDAAARAA